jgi:hypothetical protein
MKWWVFNEDQLDAALEDWTRERLAALPASAPELALEHAIVREFLNSDEARAHKLRGDPE